MSILYWILFLIVVLIIGIVVGVSYLTLRFLKKRNLDKRLRLIALIPFLIIGYLIYGAFYPSEDFYKEDFKEVAGVEFPASGKILYKNASFPDHFGDYTSVSLVKANNSFCDSLLKSIVKQGYKEVNDDDIGLMQSENLKEKLGDRIIMKEYCLNKSGGIFYYIGFLSDKETMIIQRLSW